MFPSVVAHGVEARVLYRQSDESVGPHGDCLRGAQRCERSPPSIYTCLHHCPAVHLADDHCLSPALHVLHSLDLAERAGVESAGPEVTVGDERDKMNGGWETIESKFRWLKGMC